MALKLAAFDLDETLCPLGGAIGGGTLALLRELEGAGVTTAISSGKPVHYLCAIARQAGLPQMVLMGENGAAVQFGIDFPPKRWYQRPIAAHTREALASLQAQLSDAFGERIWFQPNQVQLTPFFPPSDTALHNELRAFLTDAIKEDMGITMYDQNDCIDLCPTGLDKGTGLRYLCGQMGLSIEETAAVGNGVNDVPMLLAAGTSIGIGTVPLDGAKEMRPTIEDALRRLIELAAP